MGTQGKAKIPEFQTLEEEARFWDMHDTTEFEDDFELVDVTFARTLLRRGLTVPLDAEVVERLFRLAREKETEPSTLAQTWILDRLQAETAHTG